MIIQPPTPLLVVVCFAYGNLAHFNPLLPCLAQTTLEKV